MPPMAANATNAGRGGEAGRRCIQKIRCAATPENEPGREDRRQRNLHRAADESGAGRGSLVGALPGYD